MSMSARQSQECVATHRRVVLIVEDAILVRLTIADYLRGAGYAIFEAANAAEAVAVFASEGGWMLFLLMCRYRVSWMGSCSRAGFRSIIPASKCWSPRARVMPTFPLGSCLTRFLFETVLARGSSRSNPLATGTMTRLGATIWRRRLQQPYDALKHQCSQVCQ
jgi:CheY-like chemotaxis protein